MKTRARFCGMVFFAVFSVLGAGDAGAQDNQQVLENARRLIAAGNAKQAYSDLAALQDKMTGMPDFDYLLGVAALDSGRIEDAIIAFERVLALVPNHAGAQMDLARAYYMAGSFDLAEAAFLRLRAANPPAAALIAINRYLDAIQTRKQQTRPGWTAFGELGLGYDSNLTGVPTDFGAAAQQSFGISGFQATGNSLKRDAPFVQGAAGAEYHYPLSRGWSLFAGGEIRGRAYQHHGRLDTDPGDVDFNIAQGEIHFGGALNAGDDQYRATATYAPFQQEGAAPGDPRPTNDRRLTGLNLDWRHGLDSRTQLGMSLQLSTVRFPENKVEDFDQIYLAGSWLKTFQGRGSPLLYLTGFVTYDNAKNDFDSGVGGMPTNKSKNLFGVRGYYQYSFNTRFQGYTSLSAIGRKDKEDYARSTLVKEGKDTFFEGVLGVNWQFRDKCALRVQWAYSNNASNIDIYDFNRNEVVSNIRCDML